MWKKYFIINILFAEHNLRNPSLGRKLEILEDKDD